MARRDPRSAFNNLGCVGRRARKPCDNIIDALWVGTRKFIEGNLGTNGGSTVRGSKDTFREPDAYAGITGRVGQRTVNTVAVQHEHFVLFHFDVSQVLVKGDAFDELGALFGTEVWAIARYSKTGRNYIKAISGV